MSNEPIWKKFERQREGKTPVPYTESASLREDICGWICNVCRRFYGEEDFSEHAARSCCAESVPCQECGAHNPPRSYCRACSTKRTAEQYEKAERVEWDGETPLCLWDDDTYFFEPSALADWLEDEDERTLENTWLSICVPDKGPSFDMADFLADHLPEDHDVPEGGMELEKAVNEWVEKQKPLCWWGGKTVPTLESVRREIE